MTRRAVVIVGIGLLAGLGVYLLAGHRHMGPRARIRAAISRAATAAEHQDLGGVLDEVGPRFRGHGLDRQSLKAYLFAAMQQNRWRKVVLSDTDVDLTSKTTAEVHTHVLLVGGSGLSLSGAARYRLALGLQVEDGHWKVVRADWQPVSGSAPGTP